MMVFGLKKCPGRAKADLGKVLPRPAAWAESTGLQAGKSPAMFRGTLAWENAGYFSSLCGMGKSSGGTPASRGGSSFRTKSFGNS
jgi:hypothetical protein